MNDKETIMHLRCCADIAPLLNRCHLCPFSADTCEGNAFCGNDDVETFAKNVCKLLDEQNERIYELQEALFMMCWQYCNDDDKTFSHRCMSAEETAFAALGIKVGESVNDVASRLKIKWWEKT